MQAEAANRWKHKYHDQLDLIDRKESDWKSLEATLKHTIGRLSLAAEGQDSTLDHHLGNLRIALRRQVNQSHLQSITEGISNAIHGLEDRPIVKKRDQIKLLEQLVNQLEIPKSQIKPQKILLIKLHNADDSAAPSLLAESLNLIQGLVPHKNDTHSLTKPSLFARLLPSGQSEKSPVVTHDLSVLLSPLQHLLERLPWPDPLQPDVASLLNQLGNSDSLTTTQQRLGDFENLISRWPKPTAISVQNASTLSQGPQETQENEADNSQSLLISLLDLLVIPPTLQGQADALVQCLSADAPPKDWRPLLKTIAALINRVQQSLQHEKDEIEAFLLQMTGRLRDMDRFLIDTSDNLQSAAQQGKQLDDQINEQVSVLHQDVEAATELAALKQSVSGKLDIMAKHIQQYRHTEQQRGQSALKEIDAMRERMATLEEESQSLKRVIEEKNHQANSDALTGVPNRLAFNERVSTEVERRKISGNNLYMAMWDIDFFKKVNDTYGHSAGDKVLIKVAQTLNNGIRESDFFARFGGEEFVLLMPDMNAADAIDRLNILRRQVEACRFAYQGESLTVTVSCGVSCFGEDEDIEPVFERADAALYEAKHNGRNQCVLKGCEDV